MASKTPEIKNIEQLLHNHLDDGDDHRQYVTYTAKRLTAPGENYGSTMLSLDVILKDRKDPSRQSTLNLVAKLCPCNEWLKQMFNVKITFKKEIAMYAEIMPELVTFQKERNVRDRDVMNVVPKCLAARISLDGDEVDDDAVILLENLKTSGFVTCDRMKGFDVATTKVILKDLAEFHAVPIAMRAFERQRYDEKIQPHLFKVDPGAEIGEDVEKKMGENIVKCVMEDPACALYMDRCLKAMAVGADLYKKPMTINKLYDTILHNDYWVNNTMIRFDGEQPVENKMVDFQFFSYGSSVRDVIFFLFTSVKRSLLLDNYDELLDHYYGCFIRCLNNLKYNTDAYSYESFDEEINSIAPTEFFHVIVMLRPIFAIEKNIMSMEDMDETVMFKDGLVSDLYKDTLIATIKTFADKNWI